MPKSRKRAKPKAKRKTKAEPKWESFERVVAAIHFAEMQGAKVTWNETIEGRHRRVGELATAVHRTLRLWNGVFRSGSLALVADAADLTHAQTTRVLLRLYRANQVRIFARG